MKSRLACRALLAALLAGCGGGPGGGPPEILYGGDVCDRCRMVISEPRHAAAARIDGQDRRYDDPGCLRDDLAASERAGAVGVWVHDETGAWRRVEEVWFVEDPEGRTPMGSGLLAYGSEEAAAEAARAHGTEPSRGTLRAGPGAGDSR